jgi:hypothetical protein
MIFEDNACEVIFKVIFAKFKGKGVSNMTKSRVVQTFTKFLSLYDLKMKKDS